MLIFLILNYLMSVSFVNDLQFVKLGMASAMVYAQTWWLVPLGSTLLCSSFVVSFPRDQQEFYKHTGEIGDLLCPPVVS